MKAKDLVSIARQSFEEWVEDKAPKEAAALAYYTLLSVPALLLLIQWILGQVVSEQVQAQVIQFVQQAVRGGGSEAITAMIENADGPGEGGIATVISLATLALSATGVVLQLEQSLNLMWEIEAGDVKFVGKIKERLSSLAIVMALGLFLLVSVSLSTVVAGIAETLTGYLPLGEWFLQLANILLSFVLLTLLFGATLKVIPDADVAWSDVWLGAMVTASLFIVGQFGLSLYLGKSAPGSAYGPGASVVAFVVWVYYSALILFLGAEFTQVYANRFGSHIKIDESAVPLQEKVVREQSHPAREPAPDPDNAATSALVRERIERGDPEQTRPGLTRQPIPPEPHPSLLTNQMPTREQKLQAKMEQFTGYVVGVLAVIVGVIRIVKSLSKGARQAG